MLRFRLPSPVLYFHFFSVLTSSISGQTAANINATLRTSVSTWTGGVGLVE
jgi:hypothetical protein